MTEQNILSALPAYDWLQKYAALLREHDITSLPTLARTLRDPSVAPELRLAACWVCIGLARWRGRRYVGIDRRRIVPALQQAFHAREQEVREAAIRALGLLRAQGAYRMLLALAVDKAEHADLRASALNACSQLHDERTLPYLRAIIFDETDDILVRSESLEWSAALPIRDYIALLSNTSADLRFWSAFRLAGMTYEADISPVLDALDQVAAFDQAVPVGFGWHVDREALRALDILRYAPYHPRDDEAHDEPYAHWWYTGTWVISPRLEYSDFLRQHRIWQDHGYYETTPLPAVDLRIEPDWLRAQLMAAWSPIQFDLPIRAKQTYTLEWCVQIDGRNLIGGLHHDGYGVVLTGADQAMRTFVAWYAGLFESPSMRLYEWADYGVSLTPGMTPDDIARAIEAMKDATPA